jgi:hypothetical protein
MKYKEDEKLVMILSSAAIPPEFWALRLDFDEMWEGGRAKLV